MTLLSIGLTNPKSVSNVGAVMRAAGCFGVDRVAYSGTRFDRARSFGTDTKNIADSVPLTHCEDLYAEVQPEQAFVCVEFAVGAQSLTSFEHPASAFYLFGAEDGSISQDHIDCADHVVFIPTVGCLNLAAAVNVMLYDRLAKAPQYRALVEDNELVRHSRDCNNRLKIKSTG